MRRLFSHVLIAVFTFALGTTATCIVNFSEDSLVEFAEDGLNFGHATIIWQDPQLVPPHVNSCGHLIVTIGWIASFILTQRKKALWMIPKTCYGGWDSHSAYVLRCMFTDLASKPLLMCRKINA